LADREKQIARMNDYIIRMQRELNSLTDGSYSRKLSASVSGGRREEIGDKSVSSVEAPQQGDERPGEPVRQMILAAKRKAKSRGKDATSRIAAFPSIPGDKGKTPSVVERPQEPPKVIVTARPDKQKLPEQFVIVPVSDAIEGIQFPLNKKILTVGRSPENDIRVRDISISRFHARIILENSGVTLEDLGSTNGLRVNSQHKKRYAIKHGDRFKIGRIEFELVDLAVRAEGLRIELTT
jgi:hypothetical protein